VVPPDFPGVSTENNGEVAPGYLFLTSSVDVEGVGYYLMVLDNEGDPVMYRKLPEDYAYDLRCSPADCSLMHSLFHITGIPGEGIVFICFLTSR